MVLKYYLGVPSDIDSEVLTTENMYEIKKNPEMVYKANSSERTDNKAFTYHYTGLMYLSDYGYASPNCRDISIARFDESCLNENWLYNSAPFINNGKCLITSSSGNVYECLYLTSTGNITTDSCQTSYAIRPTFYLDASSFKIVGGSGTFIDSYHIG